MFLGPKSTLGRPRAPFSAPGRRQGDHFGGRGLVGRPHVSKIIDKSIKQQQEYIVWHAVGPLAWRIAKISAGVTLNSQKVI